MGSKFRHTDCQQLAVTVLGFIDWELEPSDQEKLVKAMIGDLDHRRVQPRGPKIIYTAEVMKLRGAAMEALKNQIIAHTSGIGDGSVRSSFKRLEEQRRYGS